MLVDKNTFTVIRVGFISKAVAKAEQLSFLPATRQPGEHQSI